MFYSFISCLSDYNLMHNLFHYITFRSGCALITSIIISMILIRVIIATQQKYHISQPIRTCGPKSHNKKSNTPTMGGIAIVLSVLLSTILWADISNNYVWIMCFVILIFGLLGFIDDILKIKKSNHYGLKGKLKLLVQILVSLIAYYCIQKIAPDQHKHHLLFPFFKNLYIDLGIFYFVFAIFVIVGSSNAVNLTDGLDGLAIVPIIIVAFCFFVIAYLAGSSKFANYLQIYYVENCAELAIFCASIIGAGLGFLWYNAAPADIFMGDTGSLAIGGSLGTLSIITKNELVLAITGGVFVIETLSVIIQVYYYKLTGGKRLFLMAPIHHHFEQKGISETKVVIRFWIISTIFGIIGLSTLKLR